MNYSMQKFDFSRVKSFCSFALLFILTFQISLAGVTFSFGSDGHAALESYNHESSSVSVFCIEDVEDKNIKLPSLSLNLFYYDNPRLYSFGNNPLNDYIHSLNHSRSPPVS